MRRTLLVLLAAALPAAAQNGLLVPTSTGRPDPTVLSLREMAIDVGVARGYARVNVRQVYENHTSAIQEGTWRFALPPSGAVGDFAVWDGMTRIPGVILEKKRARAIYQQLTTQRIDPGLLQQGEEEDASGEGRSGDRPSGGASFSVRVAPIPAWGTKRLELQYQHDVPWSNGVGEIRVNLRPGGGAAAMTAGRLDVRVTLLDGKLLAPVKGALEMTVQGDTATYTGTGVKLTRNVVLKFQPADSAPLGLSAFRNPSGSLPDGLALAPWERPSEVPPEKDGFFLLEYRPAPSPKAAGGRKAAPARPPVSLAILFDTSLSQRWGGLERSFSLLVKLLDSLRADDRFALIPFDQKPAAAPAGLVAAAPQARQDALAYLRGRPLGPGTDVAAAVKAGAAALAGARNGRLVLFTDGVGPTGDLVAAKGALPLYTIATGEEQRESLSAPSTQTLGAGLASDDESADEALFFRQLFEGPATAAAPKPRGDDNAFTVAGADPKLRDVYAVMTQPPVPGSLSGWVGRYGTPVAAATLTLKGAPATAVTGPFPETALEARDLPRRWARARVDDLLRRIELEGERKEWVDEILALSRRYKFVTPYTAFLAAPRSLLRPRRIQPGDPLIRIEADPAIVAATALLPFGQRLDLARRPRSNVWEGRFLVPDGLPDGRMSVRVILRDVSGAVVTETKVAVLDGTPPTVRPETVTTAEAGQPLRVAARADADTIFLSARLDDGPPIPLRWEAASKTSVAMLYVPPGLIGRHALFFEAMDGAGNHGFARATVEVR